MTKILTISKETLNELSSFLFIRGCTKLSRKAKYAWKKMLDCKFDLVIRVR